MHRKLKVLIVRWLASRIETRARRLRRALRCGPSPGSRCWRKFCDSRQTFERENACLVAQDMVPSPCVRGTAAVAEDEATQARDGRALCLRPDRY